MPKCRRVSPHCRTLKAGRKASSGKSCSRNGNNGTSVRGFQRPKGCGATSSAASMIQAFARGRIARRSSSRKRSIKRISQSSAIRKLQRAFRRSRARKSAGWSTVGPRRSNRLKK